MRKPDKPGSFRILDKGGTHTLTGRKLNGDKVRIPLLSRTEAEEIASKLFPSIGLIPGMPLVTPDPFRATVPDLDFPEQADFWASPALKKDTAAINASMGLGTAPIPVTPVVTSVEEAEKKAKRAKNAKSMTELIGVAGAAGDVMLGRKACEWFDKETVTPNPRQVNDLADSIKETLTGWFGDRDIPPWQMMLLLAIGLPMSMVLQGKPKKQLTEAPRENLKSLP